MRRVETARSIASYIRESQVEDHRVGIGNTKISMRRVEIGTEVVNDDSATGHMIDTNKNEVQTDKKKVQTGGNMIKVVMREKDCIVEKGEKREKSENIVERMKRVIQIMEKKNGKFWFGYITKLLIKLRHLHKTIFLLSVLHGKMVK